MPRLTSPERQRLMAISLARGLSATIQERGIKIKWVAARSGISPDTASRVLSGLRPASFGILADIGESLGMELHMEWRVKK